MSEQNPREALPGGMQATQLELGPILSSNGYFVVREGRYFGKDVAVKKPVPECRHPYVGYEFRHEIELLLSLPAHRNIVSCHGTVHAGADVTLVLEKADMSMNSLLCDHDFVLDWRIRGKLALDVARGLQHLHHYGFLHGDLKSGNVLVFLGESDEDITAKLCDFGMCRRTSDTSVHSGVPHSCGTLEWSAPETLTSEDTANLAYTYTAASGMVFVVLSLVVTLIEFCRGVQSWCAIMGACRATCALHGSRCRDGVPRYCARRSPSQHPTGHAALAGASHTRLLAAGPATAPLCVCGGASATAVFG